MLFKSKEDLGLVLSRLTALDRIPFKCIANSKDILQGLKARGFSPPETANGIKRAVFKFANAIREKLKTEIQSYIQSGGCYSASLDEYTSLKNQRYMSINLHNGTTPISLGMVRVRGSLPAETAVELFDERLAMFDLDRMRHIVGITTDGAAVMQKMGRLSKVKQQLCLSHGTHLAVCDLVYKQPSIDELPESESEDESSDVEENDRSISRNPSFVEDFQPLIQKIRKLVAMFRRSPVKNDSLQKHVKTAHSKELHLIADCKTRWNSLLHMLKRFLLLKNELQKALLDHGQLEEFLTNDEVERLKDLVDVLETMEIGSVNISTNDSSLLDADQVMEFTLEKLQDNQSSIGRKMHELLLKRFEERRNPLLSGILHQLSQSSDSSLDYPMRNDLIKKMKDLYVRLFSSSESMGAEEPQPSTSTSEEQEQPSKKSKVEELKAFLEKKKASAKEKNSVGNLSSSSAILLEIRREMTIFETTGQRPPCLDKIFKAVSTPPPTSVEAERAFSAAGLFVTKMRSSLSDNSIDTLCFLRHHLLKLN